LLRPGVGCFGLESAPSAWNRLLHFCLGLESAPPSLASAGVGSFPPLSGQASAGPLQESASSSLSGCTTGSTAVGLGRMRQESVHSTGIGCLPLCRGQESAAHLFGSARSRLLTSLSRPGVGSSELVVGLSGLVALCWWTGLRLPASVVSSWWSWWSTVGCTGVCLSRYTTRPTWCAHLRQFCLTCFTSCGLRQCTPVARSSFTPGGLRPFPSVARSSFSSFPQFTTPVSVVTPSSGGLLSSLQCGLPQSVTPCAPSVRCPPASS